MMKKNLSVPIGTTQMIYVQVTEGDGSARQYNNTDIVRFGVKKRC